MTTQTMNRPATTKKSFASASLSVKNIGEDGEFVGYASVFNLIDSHGDRVVSGAFNRSIQEKKPAQIAMLWQHDHSQPIGVWEAFFEDENGLNARGRLALNTQRGREAYELLKMGAFNGLSIGFMVEESREAQDGVRELVRIDLWEVSLVTFPSNSQSTILGIRSALASGNYPTKRDLEDELRNHFGFSRRDATKLVVGGYDNMVDERDAEDQTLTDERDAEGAELKEALAKLQASMSSNRN